MYGVMYEVQGPIESYDAVAAELDRLDAGASPQGLLTHIGMPTDSGFRIVEVWESQADSDRYGDERVSPTIRQVAEGIADRPPTVTEFEVRRLQLGAPSLPKARAATEDSTIEYLA